MTRISAPEFRGNIAGRLVSPSLRAGVRIFILFLLSTAVACFPSGPSSAVSNDRQSFFRVAPENCAAMFTLPDLDGRNHSLLAQKGRPVAVHFFATWCESCKAEFGSLQQFSGRWHEKLAVIAVSVGEVPGRVRSFLKETPASFPVLLDADRSVTKAWSVDGLPTTILLNENLRPILAATGDLDWTNADVGSEIEAALAKDSELRRPDCTKENIR